MSESEIALIEAVRRRPAMYTGSTSIRGFNELLRRIFRYAVDYLNAKEFSFQINGKTSGKISFSKIDGIFNDRVLSDPIDNHPHGLGGFYEIAALNALSSSFQIRIEIDDEATRTLVFSKGSCRSGIIAREDLRASKISISFELDTSIWDTGSYLNPYFYLDYMQTLALLSKRKTIDFAFNGNERDSIVRFEFEDGLSELIEMKRLRSISDSLYFPANLEIDSDTFKAEIAFGFWENSINIPYQISFVNHEISQENGVHLDSVFAGIHLAVNEYLAKNVETDEDHEISESAIRRSLNCAVHVKMARPHFEGSYRGKLLSPEIASPIREVVYAELWKKLENDRPQADELTRYLSRNWRLNER